MLIVTIICNHFKKKIYSFLQILCVIRKTNYFIGVSKCYVSYLAILIHLYKMRLEILSGDNRESK